MLALTTVCYSIQAYIILIVDSEKHEGSKPFESDHIVCLERDGWSVLKYMSK